MYLEVVIFFISSCLEQETAVYSTSFSSYKFPTHVTITLKVFLLTSATSLLTCQPSAESDLVYVSLIIIMLQNVIICHTPV